MLYLGVSTKADLSHGGFPPRPTMLVWGFRGERTALEICAGASPSSAARASAAAPASASDPVHGRGHTAQVSHWLTAAVPVDNPYCSCELTPPPPILCTCRTHKVV